LQPPLILDKTFCVRARRAGKHDFTSNNIEVELGSKLIESSNGVSLTQPESTVRMEIRDKQCFVYTDTIEGIGGMPAASSGKVLCLFSGGIDSPVAAFQMLKRGCEVDFLLFNSMGEKLLSQVANVYNFLTANYAYGYKPKFYVVEGSKLVAEIQEKVQDSHRQLALKIVLYKIAEQVAQNEHLAIVTGEALSQKSSQTLQSLNFIEKNVSIPILRPLIAMDKVEITKLAQKLGTFASSEKIKEYCNLSTGPVTTKPKEADERYIPEFDISNIKTVITEGQLVIEQPEETIPSLKNVVTVDVRSSTLQKKAPLDTDLQIPYHEVTEYNFDDSKSYLLICDFGVLSDNAAFSLQRKRIKAASMSIPDYQKYFKRKIAA